MNSQTPAPAGVLLVSHGSPRPEANEAFQQFVAHIAARAPDLDIRATFFSITRPSIADRVDELAAAGVDRICLQPYFLFNGQHIRVDIPAQVEACRQKYPQLRIEVLPTLQDEPAMEDIVLDRLQAHIGAAAPALPETPHGIAERSRRIIDARLGPVAPGEAFARAVLRRVIHATADFSFRRSLRIHPDAERVSRAALAARRAIVCDVKMVQAGITKATGCALHCAVGDAGVADAAKAQGCTRSAAAMAKLAETWRDGIVAIGNAPTALWKVMDIVRQGGPRPALVVGVPVGFVGALESKQALLDSGLCYITNLSPRGGSPVAAAIVNALASTDGE